MKKIALFAGLLTIGISYAFLYFGNIFSSFHTMLLSKILGVTFEFVLLLSSILLIIIFKKEKKVYLSMTIIALIVFLVHWLLLFTVGFIKPYSYAMDVVISIIYIIILSDNWELFVKKSWKDVGATSCKCKYAVTPAVPPILPLVESSRRQFRIFAHTNSAIKIEAKCNLMLIKTP